MMNLAVKWRSRSLKSASGCWIVVRVFKTHWSSMSNPQKYSQLPKIELHVHSDGACRLKTLQDLSIQHGCPYPHHDLEEFKKVVSLPCATNSLKEFLSVFIALGNILKTKASLERIAYEFCEDAAKHNVVYAEYRFNPYPMAEGTCIAEEYCEGIFAGLEKGQKEFNVTVRSLLSFLREVPERVNDIMDLAEKYRDRGVVGVDIAGNELLPLDARHVAGFERARQLGLHVTVHAAESGPASNVTQAVEKMGAERIGHGYHVLDDPKVYKFAKEKNLHFEACPTSSIYTNSSTFEEHALKAFAKDDVSFSLNTDDPGVIDTDLTKEYCVAEEKIGLTQHQLMRSVLHAAQASFLPPQEKEKLVKTVKEKLVQFDPTFKC